MPTIFISERDAIIFRNLIEQGKRVALSIDIDSTETKSDKPVLEYYIMINDPLSYKLLRKIHKFRFDSYGLMKFRPIYSFKDLRLHSNKNLHNCFNNNRYCIHAEKHQPFKTEEYREEAIRQLCLWRQSNNNSNAEKQWWKYMEAFSKLCLYNKGVYSLKLCSDTVFELAGIDNKVLEEVQTCFDKYSRYNDNIDIIDEQLKSFYDFEQYPGIVINNKLIRGYKSKKSIITSVCDTYVYRPAACQEYDFHIKTYNLAKNTSFWHLHFILVFCALLVVIAIIFVKNYMTSVVSQDIEQNVKNHVHTYYKITETDKRMNDIELRPEEAG